MMLEGPDHSESSDLSKSSNLQNLKLFLTQKVVLINLLQSSMAVKDSNMKKNMFFIKIKC